MLLLAPCQGTTVDSESPADFDTGPDTEAPAEGVTSVPIGAPVTATIGADGGTIRAEADGTAWTLDVPAGALDAPVAITMTPVELADLDGPLDGLGLGVLLGPDGLVFEPPATLTAVGYPDDALALGLVWSASGPVAWQAPGGAGDRWTLEIPHFSGGGLANFLPERWIGVLDLLGALPEATIGTVADAPGVGETTRFVCVTVTNGAGRPQPNVPVRFELGGSDDEVGFLSHADPRTDAAGEACVFWNSRGTPGPYGTLVQLRATVLEGAAFELDLATTFQWGGELPRVTLSGVAANEDLKEGLSREVCGHVSFEDARPLAGYPITLTSFGSDFLPLAFESTTSGLGSACTTLVVPQSDTLGDEGQLVDIAAIVRLAPGRGAVDLRSVRVVEERLLTLVYAPPLPPRVAPGADPLDVCVDVSVNATPVAAVTVDYHLAGEGSLEHAAVVGANGRACTRYQAPAEVQDGPVLITASAILDGRSGTVSHALEVAEAPTPVVYSGTFSERFVATRVDGLGRRMEGDGAGQGLATLRLRRHPDGRWETLEVSGEYTQSHYELCDLTERITFNTTSSIAETAGRVFFAVSGPAEAVRGRLGSLDGCSLVHIESASRAPPVATLQPDGRYLGALVVQATEPNGTIRDAESTLVLTPE